MLGVLLAAASAAQASAQRLASPRGAVATQIGERWLELDYGRPLLRGRRPFAGPDFFSRLNDGAPVWRAGANQSTTLRTEVPLRLGGVLVEPGKYTLFIELRHEGWVLIVSRWKAQKRYRQNDRSALFGAYHYRPHKDVVRVGMALDRLDYRVEQLTWQFLAVSEAGGQLAIVWDDLRAQVAYEVVHEADR